MDAQKNIANVGKWERNVGRIASARTVRICNEWQNISMFNDLYKHFMHGKAF